MSRPTLVLRTQRPWTGLESGQRQTHRYRWRRRAPIDVVTATKKNRVRGTGLEKTNAYISHDSQSAHHLDVSDLDLVATIEYMISQFPCDVKRL